MEFITRISIFLWSDDSLKPIISMQDSSIFVLTVIFNKISKDLIYTSFGQGCTLEGGGGVTPPPMFCEICQKSRSRNLNGTKKSVRLKSERYHFVSKKVISVDILEMEVA